MKPASRAEHLADWLRRQGFFLALLGSLALAAALPRFSAPEGLLFPALTQPLAVWLIFFLQGLALPTAALQESSGRWKLHLTIQAWVFLGAPLLGGGLAALLGERLAPSLSAGLIYLAIVPTTVTSAMILTDQAGGDRASALLNCVLANFLGLLLVPFWSALWLVDDPAALPWGPTLAKLSGLILLPFLLGQGVRWLRPPWAELLRPRVRLLNHGLICYIVFLAFGQSFLGGAWRQIDLGQGALLTGAVGGLLVALTVLTNLSGRWLGFAGTQRWALLFCGSQKTLAAGLPMALVLFPSDWAQGPFLLPLLLYHPLQLLVHGYLAGRTRQS